MIDVMISPGLPGSWPNVSVVNSYSAQLPLNPEHSLPLDGGNWDSFDSASPRHLKRHLTTLLKPTHRPPPKRREMSHSSSSIHHPLVTRKPPYYDSELVEPPRSYLDSTNGTALKTTATGNLSSLRMGNGSMNSIYAPSKATVDDHHGGFVACPSWEKTPSFASGNEQSPSVSSSFEFHETPKDEPCLNGLPFSTADQKLSSFESLHMQFGEPHFSGLDQTSQWIPWTFEPDLSSQSYFSGNLSEGQHWSTPFSLATSSLIPFSGLPYHMNTTSAISGGQTSMLIAESSMTGDHTLLQPHSEPHPHLHSAMSLSAQSRGQNQSEQSLSTSSADSIKTSLHFSDSRDALLIEWKRRGLSYKDIKQIGGFKEAESTLRGRFRTLTKAKEQRVRKPKWTETDIQLLVQAVSRYSEPGVSVSRCPPKVSWKKVAQHIWDHGGSYQFGNATCKKKWCETHNLNA